MGVEPPLASNIGEEDISIGRPETFMKAMAVLMELIFTRRDLEAVRAANPPTNSTGLPLSR